MSSGGPCKQWLQKYDKSTGRPLWNINFDPINWTSRLLIAGLAIQPTNDTLIVSFTTDQVDGNASFYGTGAQWIAGRDIFISAVSLNDGSPVWKAIVGSTFHEVLIHMMVRIWFATNL
jgi:hypothetical protein